MLVRSCIILAVIMAAAAASKRVQLKGGRQQAPDSEDSPSVRKLVYNLLDEDRNATGLDTLPITLTLPPQGLLAGRAQSKALILFYNGFKVMVRPNFFLLLPCYQLLKPAGLQAKASFYRLYARGLALRGYTVMQYDLPWYKNVEIQHEVALAPRMVKWLHTLSEKQHGSEGALDFALVGAAGHSRGATLATLIYAGTGCCCCVCRCKFCGCLWQHEPDLLCGPEHPELVQAVFLVDPVDMPPRGSDGVSSPSAVAAIKAKGLAVGMSGAGVVGRCNPAGINYQASIC